MDEQSVHKPLLQNGGVENLYRKKTPMLVSSVKWVLKFVMWVLFLAWIAFMFLLPAELGSELLRNWNLATEGTVFGITGSIFLVYSGPILAIACLCIAHLIISGDEEGLHKKKTSKQPRFRLWTFPVLVDGPFGVVSATEFIGIFFFVVFILWAVYAYTIRDLTLLSKFSFPSSEKCLLMLEITGLRFGMVGMLCMAWLFLPVARGSVLLRFIDIPFEHATRYHVWLGHLTMALFTLHGLFYVIAWAIEGRLIHELLEWKNIGVANLPGVISLLAGLLMWVTSLHPVRKQYFELFFYTHQLYIVFVVFLALHVGDFIFSFAAGGIFLFILDRFLRFCQSRRTVNVLSAKCLPCGSVELVLSKPANLQYNALSFIFLQVRELSWLQWHPFSVSSSPLDGKYHLAILIKVLGGWTAKLRENILIKCGAQEQEHLPHESHMNLTVSVEGPYGHESAYHLMYDNLILVAGGIGVSPFLAVVSDILHRIKEGKPCLPKNVLIVWAVKKSNELPLLLNFDMESICPSYSEKINIETSVYVTRESEPPLEEGKLHEATRSAQYPVSKGCGMSVLVGTGNNIWSGLYVISSTIGFIYLVGMLNIFYINPYGIDWWWYKGLLFTACMVASVLIFGGAVIGLWHLWERSSSRDEYEVNETKADKAESIEVEANKDLSQKDLQSSASVLYGSRPNFEEIFASVSKNWGDVDVGVLVCGPPALQSTVAKEIRSHSLKREQEAPVFHFNSHSFDL